MFHVALDMICVELGMTIDCETPNPEGLPEEIVQDYDNIKIEILAFQTKWSDKTRTLQDTYPVPVLNYNGVKYEKTWNSLSSAYRKNKTMNFLFVTVGILRSVLTLRLTILKCHRNLAGWTSCVTRLSSFSPSDRWTTARCTRSSASASDRRKPSSTRSVFVTKVVMHNSYNELTFHSYKPSFSQTLLLYMTGILAIRVGIDWDQSLISCHYIVCFETHYCLRQSWSLFWEWL